MSDLLDQKLLFVTGKGGVGKTTVSAALALAAVARDKRVLLAMCNAKERLSHMLEVAPIGPHNQAVMPGLDAVNMVPSAALKEYGLMILRVKALYRAVFENRIVTAFLRGIPGLEAWTMLGKAFFHTTETLPDGRPVYDLVIVDGPATGHALDMLRVPQVLAELAPAGLLRREAVRARELLTDRDQASIVLVTLPEDMPTNETIELHDTLTNELQLPVSQLYINGVLPRIFDEGQGTLLDGLTATLPTTTPLGPWLAAGRRRAAREVNQADCIARLGQQLPMPQLQLPRLFVADFRQQAVQTLAMAIAAAHAPQRTDAAI